MRSKTHIRRKLVRDPLLATLRNKTRIMLTTVTQTMLMKTTHSSLSIKIVPKERNNTEDSLIKQKLIICLTIITMDKFKTIKEYSNFIDLYKLRLLLK